MSKNIKNVALAANNAPLTNMLTAADLFTKIDTLQVRQKFWLQNAYITSNVELYAILSDCFAIYLQAKSNHTLLRNLSAYIAQHNITATASTNIATRIIRLVFGDCGARAYTYAAVLTAAYEQKIETHELASWIIAQNGIENIRRSNSNKPAVSKSELQNIAIDTLSSAPTLSVVKENISEFEPNSKADHSFSAALIRPNSSGNFDIVFATNAVSTVRAILLNAGSKLNNEKQQANAANVNNAQALNVSNAVAVATVKKGNT